jgi:hypothetical protein
METKINVPRKSTTMKKHGADSREQKTYCNPQKGKRPKARQT